MEGHASCLMSMHDSPGKNAIVGCFLISSSGLLAGGHYGILTFSISCIDLLKLEASGNREM